MSKLQEDLAIYSGRKRKDIWINTHTPAICFGYPFTK